MSGPSLSDQDRKRARRFFELADQSWDHWERNAADFEQRYGGEWIAMHGPKILAHAREPETFEQELQRLSQPRDELLIRWVPPADMEFVF